jgi:hypothetical protein
MVVSFAAPAIAQTAVVDGKAAKDHYFKAERFYKIERFQDAFTEYQEAYLARPDPNFLFNMAQCQRLMGNREDAIRFYRRFLIARPDPPNLAMVERHIRELEEIRPSPVLSATVAPPPVAPRKAAVLGGASKPSVQANNTAPAPSPPTPSRAVPALAYDAPRAGGTSFNDGNGMRPAGVPLSGSSLAPPPVVQPTLPASSLAMAHAPGTTTSRPLVRNLSADADEPDATHRPIYKKWWFWTAVGAVAVGVLIIGVTAGRSSDPSCEGLTICR